MDTGTAPRYSETLQLEDLAKEQFIALAAETARVLGWTISPVTDTGFTAFINIPTDEMLEIYEAEMEEFAENEQNSLKQIILFDADEQTDDELEDIKRRKEYWLKNLALVDRLDGLQLPRELMQHNEQLRRYCKLYIKSYDLYYKAVAEETDKYNDQLSSNSQEIMILAGYLRNPSIKPKNN